PIIIDLKSLPADKLVAALLKTIPQKDWPRLRFYSTAPEHTKLIREQRQDAVVFEDRNVTFERLMRVAGSHQCTLDKSQPWIAYELVRELNVCDKTKLGSTCLDKLPFEMWTPESVKCSRRMTGAKLVFFGVNTRETYARARQLGADAVFTDDVATVKQ
ncbi:MAG: glycerophosphodiester phosphodiesterase, partial [Deltaproteobacteria bacterium]|nr:glycerophosphodiester phosphodiesterase [Deltaproteobacteria bacterium]